VAALFTLAAPTLKTSMPEGTWLASAGGPFTIHPWPPVTKLFLSAASLTDLHRPTDQISLTQYAALTVTGLIFSQYGLLVTPINYPLTAVNILLSARRRGTSGARSKPTSFKRLLARAFIDIRICGRTQEIRRGSRPVVFFPGKTFATIPLRCRETAHLSAVVPAKGLGEVAD